MGTHLGALRVVKLVGTHIQNLKLVSAHYQGKTPWGTPHRDFWKKFLADIFSRETFYFGESPSRLCIFLQHHISVIARHVLNHAVGRVVLDNAFLLCVGL